jgi:CHAT domain-containing protein
MSRKPRTGSAPWSVIGVASLFAMVLPDTPSGVALSQSLGSAKRGDETGAFGVGEPMSSCAEEPIGCRKQNDTNTLAYRFISLLRFALFGVFCCFAFIPFGWAQQQSAFDQDKLRAYDEFTRGRLQSSVEILRDLIPRAPTKFAAASLQRDIIAFCATGFFRQCSLEAHQALYSAITADRDLSPLFPDMMLYLLRERAWSDDQTFLNDVIRRGGPPSLVDTLKFPAAVAEMHLVMHSEYVRRNDLKAADEAIASTIMALLLSDSSQTDATCRILVGLVQGLFEKQDIFGALQVLSIIAPYVERSLSPASVLYADYSLLAGELISFLNAKGAAAPILSKSFDLYERLDVDRSHRNRKLAIANGLASAALVLDGDLNRARDMHARHPMQGSRNDIIGRAQFQTYAEFYFAVADVFLAVLAKTPPDGRWRGLFEKAPDWNLNEVALADVNSYRMFSLGLLESAGGNRERAARLLLDAAKLRVSKFETIQRANFEGFQFPHLVDKIMISIAMSFAFDAGSADAAELMLRAGEIVNRDPRDALSDQAVLLASQGDDRSRRNAHAYINLVRQKRDWEIKHIRQLLDDRRERDSSATLMLEYEPVVVTLSKLKAQFLTGSNVVKANGIPTLPEVQKSLSERDVFITYFPTIAGLGRLCIDRSGATHNIGAFDVAAVKTHARLIELATTASHAPDPGLDSQFPVESAIYLQRVLFAGLEACLRPGVHAIVALPRELTGVPVAALLRDAPPRLGSGHDLKRANWLIRDFSFSFVVSARHYLALSAHSRRERPPLDFLGIGDPVLDQQNLSQLAAAFTSRAGAKASDHILEMKELPETADELHAVAATFVAAKRDVLLRHQATEAKLRFKALGDYDVIHFATHGVFSKDFDGLSESALVLTPGSSAVSFDDGILSASEISRLSLRARLVVLSACNSAKFEQQQASLGVQDLQAAFTMAGAPTMIASLWPVESAAAADIMVGFFKQWRAGKSGASVSLARAMRSFLDRADGPHQHPRFWAPFIVAGDGGVEGAPTATAQSRLATLEPLEEFKSGGGVVGAAKVGTDLAISVFTDWRQENRASVLSFRGPNGAEKSRVASRDIAVGRIARSGGDILALGSRRAGGVVPLVRFFDAAGRLRRVVEYPELSEHLFLGISPAEKGAVLAAVPQPSSTSRDALLLRIDGNGKILQQAPVSFSRSNFVMDDVFVRVLPDTIAVVTNTGPALRVNTRVKNAFGLPSVCIEDAAATLLQYDRKTLRLVRERRLEQFEATAVEYWNGAVLIGGELRDGCSINGQAAIMRIPTSGEPELLWKNDSLFSSSVRGMTVKNRLWVAIHEERTLGVREMKRAGTTDDPAHYRRWGDSASATHEASILQLSAAGALLARRDLSAGLGILLNGMESIDRGVVVYGILGGVPAMAVQ